MDDRLRLARAAVSAALIAHHLGSTSTEPVTITSTPSVPHNAEVLWSSAESAKLECVRQIAWLLGWGSKLDASDDCSGRTTLPLPYLNQLREFWSIEVADLVVRTAEVLVLLEPSLDQLARQLNSGGQLSAADIAEACKEFSERLVVM